MTASLEWSVCLILTSCAWPETTVISFWQTLFLTDHVSGTTALMQQDEQIKQKLFEPPASSHPTGAHTASYRQPLGFGPMVGDTWFIALFSTEEIPCNRGRLGRVGDGRWHPGRLGEPGEPVSSGVFAIFGVWGGFAGEILAEQPVVLGESRIARRAQGAAPGQRG